MTGDSTPRLGAWARVGEFVGVVARVDGAEATLFDPAHRRQHHVPVAALTAVPAGPVRVALTVDLPVAHGVDEDDLRRWVAMLVDPMLRSRATEALTAAGLDPGITLPAVTVAVGAAPDGRGRCLCGELTDSEAQTPPACRACGRHVTPPTRSGDS